MAQALVVNLVKGSSLSGRDSVKSLRSSYTGVVSPDSGFRRSEELSHEGTMVSGFGLRVQGLGFRV